EAAAQPERPAEVVGGVARQELAEEPQPLLGEGQRRAHAAGRCHGRTPSVDDLPASNASMLAASSRAVGLSNTMSSGMFTPKTSSNLAASWAATSESPPRRKKLSSGPASETPRTSPKSSRTVSNVVEERSGPVPAAVAGAVSCAGAVSTWAVTGGGAAVAGCHGIGSRMWRFRWNGYVGRGTR